MSSPLAVAIWVEARKARASPVVLGTTLLLVAGVAILSGTLLLAADAGNEQVLAQLGPLRTGTTGAGSSAWPRRSRQPVDCSHSASS